MKKQEIINNLQDNLNNGGFLLNKANDFHNLIRLNILEKNEKCSSRYFGYWIHDVNGLGWALKISVTPGIPKEFFYELLSESIARDMGFETIESKIIKYSPDSELYGIISQDYRLEGYKIVAGNEIVDEYVNYINTDFPFTLTKWDNDMDNINVNSLPFIYSALEHHFKSQKSLHYYDQKHAESMLKTIYGNLVLRYVFSYITMQKDFHLGNWEIRESEQGVSIVPMYDMELSFNENFYDDKNTSLKASTDASLSYDEDFMYFYNSSEENKNLVDKMLYLLNPNNILKYLDSIPYFDDEFKKNVFKTYINHFEKIEKMISEEKKNISVR